MREVSPHVEDGCLEWMFEADERREAGDIEGARACDDIARALELEIETGILHCECHHKPFLKCPNLTPKEIKLCKSMSSNRR